MDFLPEKHKNRYDPAAISEKPKHREDFYESEDDFKLVKSFNESELLGGEVQLGERDEYDKMYDEKVVHGKEYLDKKLAEFKRQPFELRLNRKALEIKTGKDENIENIAVANFWSFCTQTPDEIEALGFERNQREITSVVMKTKGGDEVSISATIFRAVFDGVSASHKPQSSEIDGIKIDGGSDKKDSVNIYPKMSAHELNESMKKIKFGKTKLEDNVTYFIRDEKPIKIEIPSRKEPAFA